jgi:hypothetical protein
MMPLLTSFRVGKATKLVRFFYPSPLEEVLLRSSTRAREN